MMIRTNIYIPNGMRYQLQKHARDQGTNASAIIRDLLTKLFEGEEKTIEALALERANHENSIALIDLQMKEMSRYKAAFAELKAQFEQYTGDKPLGWIKNRKRDYIVLRGMKDDDILAELVKWVNADPADQGP